MQTRLAQHPRAACQPATQKPSETIYRDVAMRYIIRFEGKSDAVQTDADACDVFLKKTDTVKLSVRSRLSTGFPKPPPADSEFADMPY